MVMNHQRGPPHSSPLGLAKSPSSWASWRLRSPESRYVWLRSYHRTSLEMRKVLSQPDLFAFVFVNQVRMWTGAKQPQTLTWN